MSVAWLKALKENPREIFTAAADAEKIHQYITSLEISIHAPAKSDKKFDQSNFFTLKNQLKSLTPEQQQAARKVITAKLREPPKEHQETAKNGFFRLPTHRLFAGKSSEIEK